MIGALAAFAVAVLGTACVLWVSRRFAVVDVPNARSSHLRPTPTLGGLGILAGVAAGIALSPLLPTEVVRAAGLGLGVLLLAAYDDVVRPLGVVGKLGLQLLAVAAWLNYGTPMASLYLPGLGAWEPGSWGPVLGAAWLLWLMNVYNFMDGIDALTATQTVAISGSCACVLAAVGSPSAALPLVVAAAAAGFLLFNMPPARIFMGDVGSLGLGYLIGICTLTAGTAGVPVGWALLPLALYAVDTTHTLLRRAARGENVLRAHREHLYQRLVQSGWSHGAVAAAALVVTGLFALGACFGVRGHAGAAVAASLPAALLLAAAVLWKERRTGA